MLVDLKYCSRYHRLDAPMGRSSYLACLGRHVVCAQLRAPFEWVCVDCCASEGRCFAGDIAPCGGGAGGVAVPQSADMQLARVVFGSLDSL